MVQGTRNVIAHGVIHGVPYLRLAGGANAVILDPQADDIGIILVCDRDNSPIIPNKEPAGAGQPAQARRPIPYGAIAQGEGPMGGAAKMARPSTIQQDVTASGTSVHGRAHRDSARGITRSPYKFT
ncbi:hypothetical protein AWB70_03367 [Caballeronia cordobensis]|uniref:Uncharacterized protein n=1 Tax=Caballeronia cordobensis TaxID=1353886 RepID=A0A158HIG7_CABCO|nr:hypothetical protein [Caballeronia cordobensis]SAL44155.1 hypothetical protein AWB70_03367 [Caballeronia cordobensis]